MIPLAVLTVIAAAVVAALVVHARRHGADATFDLLLNPDHQQFGEQASHVRVLDREDRTP